MKQAQKGIKKIQKNCEAEGKNVGQEISQRQELILQEKERLR